MRFLQLKASDETHYGVYLNEIAYSGELWIFADTSTNDVTIYLDPPTYGKTVRVIKTSAYNHCYVKSTILAPINTSTNYFATYALNTLGQYVMFTSHTAGKIWYMVQKHGLSSSSCSCSSSSSESDSSNSNSSESFSSVSTSSESFSSESRSSESLSSESRSSYSGSWSSQSQNSESWSSQSYNSESLSSQSHSSTSHSSASYSYSSGSISTSCSSTSVSSTSNSSDSMSLSSGSDSSASFSSASLSSASLSSTSLSSASSISSGTSDQYTGYYRVSHQQFNNGLNNCDFNAWDTPSESVIYIDNAYERFGYFAEGCFNCNDTEHFAPCTQDGMNNGVDTIRRIYVTGPCPTINC